MHLSEILCDLKILSKYIFIEFRVFFEYPLNFFLGIFWSFIGLIPMYFFWNLLTTEGTLTSYSTSTIMLYTMFVWGLFYGTNLFVNIRDEIVRGDIVKILVRNISLEKYFLFKLFARIIQYHLPIIIIYLIIGLIYIGPKSILGLVFFFLGLGIGLPLIAIIICLSFWTGKNWGFFYTTSMIIMFAGGQWIPLDLLPTTLQKVLLLLPFKYMYYIPAKLFIGEYNISFQLILGYIIYSILFYSLLKIIAHYGLQRYEQLGG